MYTLDFLQVSLNLLSHSLKLFKKNTAFLVYRVHELDSFLTMHHDIVTSLMLLRGCQNISNDSRKVC